MRVNSIPRKQSELYRSISENRIFSRTLRRFVKLAKQTSNNNRLWQIEII